MSAIVTRGNAADLHLPDETVDLVVTSPPYWSLRSYQDEGAHYSGQIGDEPTFDEYLDNLIRCTREWARVLKPGGSLWINLGDKYSSAAGPKVGGRPAGLVDGHDTDRWADVPRGRAPAGAPPKSLIGLPWRYAIRCIDELGLILRAEVVWSKPNGLPESVTDRVRRSHEQVFHFVKQPRYYSAVDEVREGYAPGTAARYASGYTKPAAVVAGQTGNGVLRMDGGGPDEVNPLGKLPGSVWTIATAPLKVPASLGIDHFAAYPPELVRRIVLGWSPREVCTACGEGRRPVGERRLVDLPGGSTASVSADQASGRRTSTVRSMARGVAETTITGYACACGTQNGEQWTTTNFATPPVARLASSPSASVAGGAQTEKGSATLSASSPPTRPGVVLDPFGGTGTTALVASCYGRVGISVDLSADYCRLAQWRTTDPGERARVLGVAKPPVQVDGQIDMFGEWTA